MKLTQTERLIVIDLSNGLGHKAIAEKRCCAKRTVDAHVFSAMQKYDCHTNTQLVALLLRRKIIE